MKRVVITGFETLTPYGLGINLIKENIEKNIKAYNSSNTYINGIFYPTGVLDNTTSYFINRGIDRHIERTMTEESKYVYHTINKMISEQDIQIDSNTGISIANTIPNLNAIDRFTDNNITKYTGDIFKTFNNTIAFNIANAFNCRGPNISSASACATGLQSVIHGYDMIRLGRTKSMICGGVETFSAGYMLDIFIKLGIASKTGCRPFSKDRDGTINSEGCGILFLEELEQAIKRKAVIYGEIIGTGMNCSNNISVSDTNSIYNCMNEAINEYFTNYNSINNFNIDIINTHATGTIVGDINELEAIQMLETNNITYNKLKYYKEYLGHTIAASGAIELAYSLYNDNFEYLLKNSFGLGGTNCSILIRK